MKWDHIPCASKWGTFDIGASSASNEALNEALNWKFLDIHRIPCQITTKCGDFRYTPQPPQSPHIVVIYMRIAPHTPQCTSIAIPHNLSSCTSLHLIHLSASQTPQNGVISYIHPNHPKHPTLGWFIWGQPWTINENFHFFLLGLSGGKG